MAFEFMKKKKGSKRPASTPVDSEGNDRIRPASTGVVQEGPVSANDIERIRNQLLQTHANLVISGMMDETAKGKLRSLIQENYAVETKGGNDELVDYVLHEVISSGVVIMPFGGQGQGGGNHTYNAQQAPVLPVEGVQAPQAPSRPQQSKKGGANGVDPSRFIDITDADNPLPLGDKPSRADELKEQHAELMKRSAEMEAEKNKGREGFRQPARKGNIDDLSLIRKNQERMRSISGKKPPISAPTKLGGKKGKGAVTETTRDANGAPKLKSKSGSALVPINSEDIQKLRESIKVDEAPTYDGDAILDAMKEDDPENEKDPANFITDQELGNIRDALVQAFPGLVIRGMMEADAREELEKEVRRTYHRQTRGGEDFLVEYIVRETVGTGVIESILENDPSITDIGYDGAKLIIESNDKKYVYQSNQDINDEYIVRLVNKFAYANGRDFTQKNPIFDGKFNNIRINAMYGSNTLGGVTMALRVVRPKLALREETFDGFAPHYIYQLLKSTVMAKGNFMIAGETGTGKTELQKLLASFIPFNQRIVLIEDVAETFLKEMFPEKDIYSWLTSQDISITHLVKASLRNNPRWIIVSETRGAEAYEMIQAVLSGHSIITTLHAINARAIPKRLVNMAKMGYEFSEEALEGDIRRYFDWGIHIIRDEYQGKTLRFLSELLYFDEDGDQTVFKQEFVDGQFIVQCGEIPDVLKRRVKQAGQVTDEFTENHAHIRDINIVSAKGDNGVSRLDLSVTEGRELSYDEVASIVTDLVVEREKMTAQPTVSILPATASTIQEARQSNAPIVAVDQSPNVAGAKPVSAKPAPTTKPSGPRPTGTAPRSKEPVAKRPAGERPAGQRPTGEKPVQGKPTGQRPVAKPTQPRPEGQRPAQQRPANGQRPVVKPAQPRPEGQRPASQPPAAKPSQHRPATTTKPVANPAQRQQATGKPAVKQVPTQVGNQQVRAVPTETSKPVAKAPSQQRPPAKPEGQPRVSSPAPQRPQSEVVQAEWPPKPKKE